MNRFLDVFDLIFVVTRAVLVVWRGLRMLMCENKRLMDEYVRPYWDQAVPLTIYV